jgi:dihydrofolate reductase
MATVIAGMTVSLDGFVTDPSGSAGRLYTDLADLHHPPETPPEQDERLTFTFVTDGVASAIEQARAAAGDRAVQVVGGASVVQQLLRARLVDELRVDVMPVLLGGGIRLLENIDSERVQLEKSDVHDLGPRTSLSFRVVST